MRGRDNQRALTKADGAQEIHRAQQAVLRVFLGKQQLLGGIGSRQGVESRALSRVVRIDAVDLGDVEQRAETIVFTLGTHLARDGIAVTQVETADLRVGYVDIPAAGQIIMHAQEAIALGMDFQNDGQFVGGCIAGGRRYLHINAKGDVEPCVFIHYSNVNIHDCTLLEALKSPIFQAYHDNQPFNDNHLRPCPMLENPEKLRQMVKETGAVNTDYQDMESVDHLCDKCESYAENWKPTAERLWNQKK